MKTNAEFNVEALNGWLKQNGKGAREKLCVKARVSTAFLDNLRRTRKLPNGDKMVALADAINVPVEQLVIRGAADQESA